MGIVSALRARLRRGVAGVHIDGPAAKGEAAAAVVAAIEAVTATTAPKLRDNCTDMYLEAVLARPRLDTCVEILSRDFGAPFKPFGERREFDAATSAMIDSRGGINTDQCLYLRRYADGRIAFAALWPWGNGVAITLKIGVYDEAVAPHRP